MDAFFSFFKRRFFNYTLLIAGALTLIFGIWGWWLVYNSACDASYPDLANGCAGEPVQGSIWWRLSYATSLGVRAFLFSDDYPKPWDADYVWQVAIAGWLGSFVAASALVKGALSIFLKPLERWSATLRSDHTVLMGERRIAIQASEWLQAEGRQVTYHGDDPAMEVSSVLTVPRPATFKAPFLKRSIDDANRIIIAEATDAQTAETALAVTRLAPKSIVFAIVEDPWIAARLRDIGPPPEPGGEGEDLLIAVSEVRAQARSAVLPVPPFLLADKAGQKRIHAVLFGFNDLTIALIEEILIANIVPGQSYPRFTILARNAGAAQANFEARHPGLHEATSVSALGPVDISFIECDSKVISKVARDELAELAATDPVTIVYVTNEDGEEPLATATAIQTSARQYDLFTAPIFVQARRGSGVPPVVWSDFRPRGIYAFGAWHDLARSLGLLDEAPDKLAQAYHENYRNKVWNDFGADRSWMVLKEEFRVSNRNAVLHIPAKLHALGFDITTYLSRDDALSPSTAPKVHAGEEIIRSFDERETLARLEHERWMMERWVSGWRVGARDNDHFLHPDLIPYDDLTPEKQEYDQRFVDWLADWLERDTVNGVKR